MSKKIKMQIELEEFEHNYLKETQKQRRLNGLRYLNLREIARAYMRDGMLQHSTRKQEEARP